MAERSEGTISGKGALVVAGISLLWFAGTLWVAHNSVVGAPDPSIALIDAALALPLLIASGMVAGAATAVVVVDRLAARGRLSRIRWRLLAGAGIGLVLGAVAGALILVGYGVRGRGRPGRQPRAVRARNPRRSLQRHAA
jgi:hypothetical protein